MQKSLKKKINDEIVIWDYTHYVSPYKQEEL